MTVYKNVFGIVGSASTGSLNQKILENIATQTSANVKLAVFDNLRSLPHFNPSESINNPPPAVVEFRKKVEESDGVIICTPEYVFSIPALLKNAIEWCVSTTVFSQRPVGLITASSSGAKGHEQLQLIMNTVGATFTSDTTLLISGVKSKININGEITDPVTRQEITAFIDSFISMLYKIQSE
jgi:NAD(P)H-dependent FMN reductase